MMHEIEKLELLGKQEIEKISGLGGYTIGYDIYEGNIYEGHTLLPFIERISKKHNLSKPRGYNKYLKIEAHICIAFTAYSVYKELERALYAEKSTLSLKISAEITHNMYQLTYTLPVLKHTKSRLLKN